MSRPPQRFKHIALVAGTTPEAREAYERLQGRYGNVEPQYADVIVALGGDGLMLQTLHKFMNSGKPIYGMQRGTVGFLMNDFSIDNLIERLTAAQITVIHPLVMRARDSAGRMHEHRAINEVSLFRQSAQAAHLRILIDGQERLAQLVADGVLLATPAGSTAYNLSVQGALIPISPFRPRRWRGALLPDKAKVTIEVQDADKRPVAAVADSDEVRSVRSVDVEMDHAVSLNILRNELGRMVTRVGCGLEQCGCWMVLIDGQPEKCCAKPVWSVAGKKITTIEGLGTPERPHPLQQAFIDEQAGQCGYCLSGIIITAKALLDKNSSPTRAQIAAALDDNICRCGTHNRIMRAVAKAAAQLRAGARA